MSQLAVATTSDYYSSQIVEECYGDDQWHLPDSKDCPLLNLMPLIQMEEAPPLASIWASQIVLPAGDLQLHA